ncbi:hypothetical protein J6590_073766 [Homalodisca vitripennis]|nr:hypothetical protein J6590_073766 [Homalodisca vitripennis]
MTAQYSLPYFRLCPHALNSSTPHAHPTGHAITSLEYVDKAYLQYTDTDSLTYHIKTDDFDDNIKSVRGVKKVVIEKHLMFDDYKTLLFDRGNQIQFDEYDPKLHARIVQH